MGVYIVEIVIVNFQSHVKTVIKQLSVGINAFIGTSNSGKSAMLRAVRWCLTNDLTGNDFIRKGEKETQVIIKLSNSYAIERRKSINNTVNQYNLYLNDELIETFTGFGRNVPQPILDVHKIRPIAGDVYFNFAKQLDAPFLIADSGRQRASTIGNLEELGKIDIAVTEINDDIRASQKQRQQLSKEIAKMEMDIQQLENEITTREPQLKLLNELKESIQSKWSIIENVQNSLDRLLHIREEIVEQNQMVEKAKRILRVWNEDLPRKVELLRTLIPLHERLITIHAELVEIKFMNGETLHQLVQAVESIEKKMDHYQRAVVAQRRLESIQSEVVKIDGSYSSKVAELDVSTLEKNYKSLQVAERSHRRLIEIGDEIERINHSYSPKVAELDLSVLEKKRTSLQLVKNSHHRLIEINDEIGRIDHSYSSKVAGLDFSKIDKTVESFKVVSKQLKRLKEIQQDVGQTQGSINQAQVQIEKLLNEFVQALHDAKICPTCLQSTDEVCVHELEKSI